VTVVYSSNNFTMLNIWEFYFILVSELQQGENSGGRLYSPSECSVVLTARRLVKQCLVFLVAAKLEHPKLWKVWG
jgi:hypothetical protein